MGNVTKWWLRHTFPVLVKVEQLGKCLLKCLHIANMFLPTKRPSLVSGWITASVLPNLVSASKDLAVVKPTRLLNGATTFQIAMMASSDSRGHAPHFHHLWIGYYIDNTHPGGVYYLR